MPKFDDVINELNGFGRYQVLLMLMFVGIAIPTSYNTFLPIFVLTVPKHRCALDGVDNDTYAVQNHHHEQLINATIPLDDDLDEKVMSSCYIYRSINKSNIDLGSTFSSEMEKVKCNRWVYDKTYFDRTIIEELNLVCDKQEFRTHSNMAMMLGKLASAILQGFLSDGFGRRFTMLLFIVIVISSTFANAFIFNIPSLIAFRFIAGLSTTSIYMNAYVIALEFMGMKYRQRFNITAALIWIMGGYVLTAVAYWIRDFQHLTLALAVPTVGLISYFFLVPESPRWLLTKGRSEEARKIMESMAKINRKPFPSTMFDQMVKEEFSHDENEASDSLEETEKANGGDKKISSNDSSGAVSRNDTGGETTTADETPTKSKRENILTMIRHKRMAIRLFIVLLNWCANSMTYYGIIFNTQNLSGSIYINFSLTNAVDIAGNVGSYYFVDKFGRKRSYNTIYVLSSLILLAAIFPPLYGTKEEADTAFLALSIIGRAGVSTTFNIMYLYVAELFPTSVRNTVLGVSSMASRVGSTSAPYIADLGVLLGGNMKSALPLMVFGGAGLIAAAGAFFLPETLGKKLPNNIKEAMDIERNSSPSGSRYDLASSAINDDSQKWKDGVKVKAVKEIRA